jgi:hypothetical protein
MYIYMCFLEGVENNENRTVFVILDGVLQCTSTHIHKETKSSYFFNMYICIYFMLKAVAVASNPIDCPMNVKSK